MARAGRGLIFLLVCSAKRSEKVGVSVWTPPFFSAISKKRLFVIGFLLKWTCGVLSQAAGRASCRHGETRVTPRRPGNLPAKGGGSFEALCIFVRDGADIPRAAFETGLGAFDTRFSDLGLLRTLSILRGLRAGFLSF